MAKRQRNYTFNREWEEQYCFIEHKGKFHTNYVSTIYFLIKCLVRVKFSSVIFINIIYYYYYYYYYCIRHTAPAFRGYIKNEFLHRIFTYRTYLCKCGGLN
jgi:hypothetical protein